MAEKPELKPVVEQTLQDLQRQWEELEGTTQTKAQCLFDANRAELFTQSCSALDVWLKNLEGQLQSDDYGKDLTSVNILLKKHQVDPTVQNTGIGPGKMYPILNLSFVVTQKGCIYSFNLI